MRRLAAAIRTEAGRRAARREWPVAGLAGCRQKKLQKNCPKKIREGPLWRWVGGRFYSAPPCACAMKRYRVGGLFCPGGAAHQRGASGGTLAIGSCSLLPWHTAASPELFGIGCVRPPPRNNRLCVKELTPAVECVRPADTRELSNMLFNIAVVLVLGLGAALIAALLGGAT